MKYPDGKDIKLGDRVALSHGELAEVVACLDSGNFSAEFPKDEWDHITAGILVKTERGAVEHFKDPNLDDVRAAPRILLLR